MAPWVIYYGRSLPFPNNLLIILSSVITIAFSVSSSRLTALVRGIGTAFSAAALIPPMYFIMTLPQPPRIPSFEPEYGFYLVVILYILLMTLAAYFVFNLKQASLTTVLGLVLTLASYGYNIQQDFNYVTTSYRHIDHGYPFPWFRYVYWLRIPLDKNYSTFIESNFMFDLIIWFTIAWLLIGVFSSLIKIRHGDVHVPS